MDSLEILIDIRKIVRAINLESKRVQKDFGISIPQLLCLGHIYRAPNQIATHGELMKLLSLNSSTVTGIINRLERKGLAKRLPKSGDKRVTYIGILAVGVQVVKNAPDILHDQLASKMRQLDEPDPGNDQAIPAYHCRGDGDRKSGGRSTDYGE